MKTSDIVAVLTTVVGVCGFLGSLITSTVESIQQQLHPGIAVTIPPWVIITSGVIGAIGILAAQLIRIFTVKASAPATSIVANAPVVAPGTSVTPESTADPAVVGTNTHA